jgi:hypothetical protein
VPPRARSAGTLRGASGMASEGSVRGHPGTSALAAVDNQRVRYELTVPAPNGSAATLGVRARFTTRCQKWGGISSGHLEAKKIAMSSWWSGSSRAASQALVTAYASASMCPRHRYGLPLRYWR